VFDLSKKQRGRGSSARIEALKVPRGGRGMGRGCSSPPGVRPGEGLSPSPENFFSCQNSAFWCFFVC